MTVENNYNEELLPNHIAIIMDGNRRWARKHGKFIKIGHNAGAKRLNQAIDWFLEMGIPYLTVYAFSTENWGREKKEVDDMMDLLRKYLESEREKLKKKGVKVKVIGEFDKVVPDIKESFQQVENETKDNNKLNLAIAFSYGGRQEIVSATKKLAKKVLNGLVSIEEIDEKLFAENLYNPNMPDPDLVIRTGGSLRISNFLLWQISYSEFYFTDTLWPDFSKEDLMEAITNFQNRERRYGKDKNTKKAE